VPARNERPVATVADVEALAVALPERFRLVVLLAAWCQLRRGELLGLRRRDVDLLRGALSVEQSRTFSRDGRSLVKEPKSTAGRRTITVPAHVLPALADHLACFTASEPDVLVLTGTTGAPMTTGVLQKAWHRARLAKGRPDLHLHDLPHTGLTLAAATGATTDKLMHRAGHASPDAALCYQHAAKDRDRVLADALTKLATTAPVVAITPAAAASSRPDRAHGSAWPGERP